MGGGFYTSHAARKSAVYLRFQSLITPGLDYLGLRILVPPPIAARVPTSLDPRVSSDPIVASALQLRRSMRPHDEASTHRRAPLGRGPEHFAFAEPNSEAPTFLPAARLPVRVKTESKSASKSEKKSRSKSAPTPAPAAPTPAPADAPQLGMIDPLAVPVPPELGPTIYGWIRRIALQNDLPTADRILRDAMLEVTSSLSC